MTEKVALITGSSKRLGKDIAQFLSKHGYTVIFHYLHSKNEIDNLAKSFQKEKKNFFSFQADISQKEEVKKMAEYIKKNFKRLDLLVNNVGNYIIKDLNEITIEEWDSTIQTNLSGAFYCIYYLKDLLIKSKANIINIGYANAANLECSTQTTPYSISKTGLLMLTKSLAKSLGRKKVRVNMISPGQLEYSIDLPKNIRKEIPVGKAGTSMNICLALQHILDNEHINGANLEVTGGYIH